MATPQLTIKEPAWVYLLTIILCLLIIAFSIIVSVFILNAEGVTPQDELAIKIYAYISTSLVCTLLLCVIIWNIVAWKKRKYLFFDEQIVVMFGSKVTSSINYTDIDYYVDSWFYGVVIKGNENNQIKQNNRSKSRVFSLHLNQDTKSKLIKFLNSKGISNNLPVV